MAAPAAKGGRVSIPKPDRSKQSIFAQRPGLKKQGALRPKREDSNASEESGHYRSPEHSDEELPYVDRKRTGAQRWKDVKLKKNSVSIIAGRDRVTSLVSDLRAKLTEMRSLVGEYQDRKDQMDNETTELNQRKLSTTLSLTEAENAVANEASSADPEAGESVGVWREAERSHLFVYNPVGVVDRYLPCVGLRTIKTFRGSAIEVLGNPSIAEEVAEWKRKLRKEQALARDDQYSPPRSPLPPDSPGIRRRKRLDLLKKRKPRGRSEEEEDGSSYPSGSQTARGARVRTPDPKLERLQTKRKLWGKVGDGVERVRS
mmetsp:Transcript_38219/g.59660  ORF Transcript_38219/g.59660 Transcript_38219/m.59660 type:complete len:316 (+) Transcript_38219:52-999(+)